MAELVLQIEALAKANVSYESQIIDLSKWKTAAEAEAKSVTIALKTTEQGLEKSETLCGRLTNELAQTKAKLSAEVQAAATHKLHCANKEAELNKSLSGLQKEHDAQGSQLKTTQLALAKTQAELQECKSDLTANRDTLSATKAALHETERLLTLETKSRESFELQAKQAKNAYEMLQGSLPKQIAALNDAKTAAMAEAVSTKAALDAANNDLLARENELRDLKMAHQKLAAQAQSDGLIAAAEIVRQKDEARQMRELSDKLTAANAIGARQLMLEARAKTRTEAEKSKKEQLANDLGGRNMNLSTEVKQLQISLMAERDDHRRTSMNLAETSAGKQASMYAVGCEQKKNSELTLKLQGETRRADDLLAQLKALSAQTSGGSGQGGAGGLSAVAAAAVQRAIKQQGRGMSIASMRATARAESETSPTQGMARTPSPTKAMSPEPILPAVKMAPGGFAVE